MQLITYNILANCTLHHFPNPHAPVLQREHRTPLLLACLQDSAADIICLQEVDKQMFDQLQQTLSSYTSRLTLNRDTRFGCAMFLNSTKFPQVEWNDEPFTDATGRVAQVAKTDKLMVVNVHLDFKNNCDQMRSLVKIIPTDKSCLLCGDFNASLNSATLRIAQQAGFTTKSTGPTSNSNGRAKTIDFVLARGKLELRLVETTVHVDNNTPLPSATQGSDHVPVLAEFDVY